METIDYLKEALEKMKEEAIETATKEVGEKNMLRIDNAKLEAKAIRKEALDDLSEIRTEVGEKQKLYRELTKQLSQSNTLASNAEKDTRRAITLLSVKTDKVKELDVIIASKESELQIILNKIQEEKLTYHKLLDDTAPLKELNYLRILEDKYNAIEGDEEEDTLYYLKTTNTYGETRYKFGKTQHNVAKRYSGINNYEIIFEYKIANAPRVERTIHKLFQATNEPLLGTKGTEIYDFDIFA